MSRRVFKYGPLALGEPAEVMVPAGARVVAFSAQNGQNLYLWADVETDEPLRPLRYIVVGTGHPVPLGSDIVHAGSWVSDEYVWHLFVLRGLLPVGWP